MSNGNSASYGSSDQSGVSNSPIANGNNYGLGAGASYPAFPFAVSKGEGTSQTALGVIQNNAMVFVVAAVVLVGALMFVRGRK
jgi:hypothetical protein